MPHKFNPANIDRLDNPERKIILPSMDILLKLGLRPDDVMIDIGAGTGYFSIPASKIVGNKGRVYAVDNSAEMIEVLKSRVAESGAKNITIIISEEYDLKLDDCIADLALMCTVLHEIDDKRRFLMAVQRIMKAKSRLAIIEWSKKPMNMGPPLNDRMEMSLTQDLLKQLDFNDIAVAEYNNYFYFATARKK
jgi:ubiquinone/menaquinone biosynthesis C-methylase UbiE